MYETIKRLYLKTKNTFLVNSAIRKGWITTEQGQKIISMEA